MKIAVASGKGGTGKTTISTNLALYLAQIGRQVSYSDCDVEEPNGHLFLKPVITSITESYIQVPLIDEARCNACGKCVEFCVYRALVKLGQMVMVFPELCHGCGGCTLVCPHTAITEHNRIIGVTEQGYAGAITFIHGRLNVGEAMSPPLIRTVLDKADDESIAIIDAPPGTSCPAIASIKGSDVVLLVTEPTPFGLNDLGLALDMVQALNKPYGVIVNRADSHCTLANDFCEKRNVPILASIPDNLLIAQCYSRGEMILNCSADIYNAFASLWNAIEKQVQL